MTTPINEKLHSIEEDRYRILEEKNAVPGYWEYRKNWKKFPEEHIVSIPLNIDIELTNHCNLHCTMCPSTIYGYSDKGFMSEALYKKIVDDASSLGVPAIKLIWRGESLLHPQLIEFVAYAKKKGIIDVLLNTNATLLTPEISRGLIEAGLDKLFFSFDSPYQDQYEKIRIGANYHTVINNIKTFHEIRNEMKCSAPITRVGLVKMNQTVQELEDFNKLFCTIVDCVAYTDAFYLSENAENRMMAQHLQRDFCCPMPWQRLVISWAGRCYPCCRDEMELYCIGDVNTESIETIWKSTKMQSLRKAHMDGSWDTFKMCNICQKSMNVSEVRKDGMI